MSDFNDLIKNRRVELGLTQLDIAKATGVSEATVSRWESGQISNMRRSKIAALSKVLQLSPGTLMGMEPEAPDVTKTVGTPIDYSKYSLIPILGRIRAGLPLLAEENVEGYTLTDLNGGAEYFALRVTGDSMNAIGILEGHILHVRRQPEVENGEVAVVMVGDEDATVKRFYATDKTVTLMPQSTNPIHLPQIYDVTKTPIRVLGKVVKVEFIL